MGANRWVGCSVCSRADVAEINAALTGGQTVRTVASAFGIPRSTLGLHKTRCGTAKATEPPKATPAKGPDDRAVKAILAETAGIEATTPEARALREVVVDSIELYWEARRSNDTRTAVNTLPEIRNGLAKLRAMAEDAKPPEDSETAWFRHALFDELRTVITGALEDELARRAVAAALLGWERARTGEDA